MLSAPVTVSLPVGGRATSFRFYRDALGLDAVGEPAGDGIPEPLQFILTEGARLMLVPTGGFGWVIGDRPDAAPGHSECVLSLGTDSQTETDAVIERTAQSGAEIVTEPGQQPWGYAAAFTDPDGHVWMVTSEPLP